MMEGLQISIPQRLTIVRVILVVSMMLSMLLSVNLWCGNRFFPLAPVFDLPVLLPPLDAIWLILVILSWISSLVMRRHRLFLFISFLICTWLCICDVNRLQPWFYSGNMLLLIFVFYNGRVDDSSRYTAYFILLQIIVASVYFFNGLSQLNDGFLEYFSELISPLHAVLSERQFLLFVRFGKMVPFIMIFIGAGLIISPIRYLAIAIAVTMHVFLLIFLFPSKQHNNYALWLNNLTFLLLILFLFSGKTKQKYFSPTFLFKIPIFYLVMILFVFLPPLNQNGKWPDFLSFNFRSGGNLKASISVSERQLNVLPLYEKHFFKRLYSNMYEVDYEKWVREELNADVYPSKEVFNNIRDYFRSIPPGEAELTLQQPSRFLGKP